MAKHDRHRLVERREGQRTEEEHGGEQNAADGDPLVEKARQFLEDGIGLAGNQPFQIVAERLQQFAGRHQPGQYDDAEDQQRNEGEQRVVGDGAGQQEAPMGLEISQYPQREGERVGENLDGGRALVPRHFPVGVELAPIRRQFGNRMPEPTIRTALAGGIPSLPSRSSSKT